MNIDRCYKISIYDNDRIVEKLTFSIIQLLLLLLTLSIIQLLHNRNENDQKSL